MNKLKYIKGDDPECNRGPGFYLWVSNPGDGDFPGLFRGFKDPDFRPNCYYAGPIEAAPPDPPPTPIQFVKGTSAWKGKGYYMIRWLCDPSEAFGVSRKDHPSQLHEAAYYAGPFEMVVPAS